MSGSTSGAIAAITILSIGGEGGAGASANLSTDDSQNGVGGDAAFQEGATPVILHLSNPRLFVCRGRPGGRRP